MDFYPLEFCSIITPTELQEATCRNNEQFYLLIFHLLSLFLWDWLFTHLMTFPSLASVCMGLISLYFFVHILKYLTLSQT